MISLLLLKLCVQFQQILAFYIVICWLSIELLDLWNSWEWHLLLSLCVLENVSSLHGLILLVL